MSKLPKGWGTVCLGDVCEIARGGSPRPIQKYLTDSPEGINWIKISDATQSEKYIFKTKQKILRDGICRSRIVQDGDFILSNSMSFGRPYIVKIEGCIHDGWLVISPNREIFIQDYLYYFLNSKEAYFQFDSKAAGSTVRNLNIDIVKTVEVLIPPLNEQRRIVTKLDSLFSRTRRARAELERVSGLCDQYKKAVLEAACSGHLTADWRESNLGIDSWKNLLLGSTVQHIRYGTSKKCDYSPIRIPVLRIPNIGNGYIIHNDLKYAEFDSREVESLQVFSGDILIIRSNGSLDLVGKAAIISEKEKGFLYAGYLIKICPNLNVVLPEYLYFHLIEPKTRAEIESLAKSTSGVNNINSQELKSLNLSIPNLQEQKEIVQRVEKLFKVIDLMEQEYQKAVKLCDRLEQATLTKAFRGELVPQDPNDEPASILLERIRAERQDQPKGKAIKSKKVKN